MKWEYIRTLSVNHPENLIPMQLFTKNCDVWSTFIIFWYFLFIYSFFHLYFLSYILYKLTRAQLKCSQKLLCHLTLCWYVTWSKTPIKRFCSNSPLCSKYWRSLIHPKKWIFQLIVFSLTPNQSFQTVAVCKTIEHDRKTKHDISQVIFEI